MKESYGKYFVVSVSEVGARRSLCPYKMEKAITKAIGGMPKRTKRLHKDAFLVEVINRKENEAIRKMTEKCEKACSMQPHNLFMVGYIYIIDLDSF